MSEQVQENKMGIMPVGKLLMSMSIPMMISMLVQALYNVVDSYFVAQISQDALNAVGLAFPIQNLMIAVSVGTGVGVNALLSRSLGEKNYETANATAGNGLLLAFLSGLVFIIIGQTVPRAFYLAQTDIPGIVEQGSVYLSICCTWSMGLFMEIMFERLLQSTGNTVLTMLTQGIGAVTNIILDPILIFGFKMGVAGAALATIISQCISMLWILRFLTGDKTVLRIRRKNLRLSAPIILPAVALGLSPFIMQSTESLLSVCFNSSLLKYGGDLAVGTMTIASSIMQFSLLPLQGLTQGAQPIVSYNFGAHQMERVKKTFRILLISCVSYSMTLWALVMLMPQVFIRLFNNSPELVTFGVPAIRMYMGMTGIFGIQIACQQTFISLGNAKNSLFLALLRKIILLIPLIYIMPAIFTDNQTMAVFMAEPVADFLAVATTACMFALYFRRIMRGSEEGKTQVS